MPSADLAVAAAELEEERVRLLNGATELAAMQHWLEAAQHEYDTAHGFTPAADVPTRLWQVQRHGGVIGQMLGADPPTYNTPVKNMHVVEAAAAEMNDLEGEELLQQQWVHDLIAASNQ